MKLDCSDLVHVGVFKDRDAAACVEIVTDDLAAVRADAEMDA